MNVTIIPPDKVIIIDGAPLIFDYSAPAGIHAIQWHGTDGDIEYTDGSHKAIADIADIQAYIETYSAEAQRIYDLEHPAYTAEERLSMAKDAKVAEINAARTAAVDGGVKYGGHTWDSDSDSRNNLTGLVAGLQAGVPLPGGFVWRAADNNDVALTAAEVIEFGAAMLLHVNAQYQKSWVLKNQVEAATTAAEVEAIAW
jgi:hypothetical protein